MAVDKNIINAKLEELKTAIRKIEDMDLTLETILGDEDIQDLIDRRMQIAIENCIDIVTHLSAGLELPRKEYASDIFLLLGKNDILSEDITRKMAGATGLRNILVHEYADIDYKLAYSDLKDKLKDLKTFARQVIEFLEKQD